MLLQIVILVSYCEYFKEKMSLKKKYLMTWFIIYLFSWNLQIVILVSYCEFFKEKMSLKKNIWWLDLSFIYFLGTGTQYIDDDTKHYNENWITLNHIFNISFISFISMKIYSNLISILSCIKKCLYKKLYS